MLLVRPREVPCLLSLINELPEQGKQIQTVIVAVVLNLIKRPGEISCLRGSC